MKHLPLALSIICLVGVTATFSGPAPIVDLGYAKYVGAFDKISNFYGLRYAVPPTGNLRWRAPVPIETTNTNELIDASLPGPQCYQTEPVWLSVFEKEIVANGSAAVTGIDPDDFSDAPTARISSEDCLLLDVLVPSNPKAPKLPVVVQIHGGGYTLGNSQTNAGDHFVHFSQGKVIYVQIQYRLGPYGFLSSDEIRINGAINAGLLDQRAALEWVQRHIFRFGGDPERVTVWGGSAGGGSVTAQLIMFGGQSDPPFRAAIPEYPWWQAFHEQDILDEQYEDMLSLTACIDLACLRGLPELALSTAAQLVYAVGWVKNLYGYGDYYFGPSVDGVIVQDLPSRELQAGHFSRVPILFDHSTYEGALFTNLTLTTEQEVISNLEVIWPQARAEPDFWDELFSIYPLSDFGETYFEENPFIIKLSEILPDTFNNSAFWQRQDIYGDFIINCPTYYLATYVTNADQRVWKMKFDGGDETHGASENYLFGPPEATSTPLLAAQMKDYFLSFILELDPNVVASVPKPNWPEYGNVEEPQILVVTESNFTISGDPDAWDGCLFFLQQGSIVRN